MTDRIAPTRRNPAIWPLWVLLAALVGVPVVVLGRAALDRPASPLDIGAGPRAYRIVYEVEDHQFDPPAVRTETRIVARPDRSRLDVRDSDGTPVTLEISAGGEIAVGVDRSSATVFPDRLGIAAADVRVGSIIDEAVERGLVERMKQRSEVLGRPCDRFRTGGTIDDEALAPPGSQDATVVWCIDAEGFVLSEEWSGPNGLVQRRTATVVDVDVDAPARDFAIAGQRPGRDVGGGAVLAVADASRAPEVLAYELAGPPARYEATGKFLFVPTVALAATGEPQSGDRTGSIVSLYTFGADVIAVENGARLNTSRPFEPSPHRRIVEDVGEIGDVEVILGVRFTTVRAALGAGRFVQVYGTAPIDDLVAVARDLRPMDGGEITILG